MFFFSPSVSPSAFFPLRCNTQVHKTRHSAQITEYIHRDNNETDDILHNLQNVYRYTIGTTTRQRQDNVTKDEQDERANWTAMMRTLSFPTRVRTNDVSEVTTNLIITNVATRHFRRKPNCRQGKHATKHGILSYKQLCYNEARGKN